MSVVGIAGIYPALPLIADSLNVTRDKIGLLIAVYALPGIVFTPILGILADRIGRKKVLVPALFLFGIAGTACAFVYDFETLLIFRFFQGIAASSLGALNVTIIGDIYRDERRFTAMGMNNSALSFGTATFPLIGGGLAELSWHFPFLLPALAVPIGIIALFMLDTPEPKSKDDFKSYFKIVAENFTDFKIIGLFIVSFLTFIILIGAFVNYVPLYIKTNFSSSPFFIGLIVSSMSLTQSLTASQLGKFALKTDKFHLLAISFILYAAGLLMFLIIPVYELLFIPAMIFGVGQGLNVPNLQTILAGYVGTGQRAAYMSINRMVSLAGQAAGPVLMGLIFAEVSFIGVFLTALCLAFIAVIVIYIVGHYELSERYDM
jgi:MFS family permease